jgi:hypothetical protein
MTKQFVIRDIETGKLFVGSDWQNAIFSGEEKPKLFDSETLAAMRLQNEAEIFPDKFDGRIFEIVPVITF